MSIHSEHPFATPAGDRDPVRRFRGRAPAPIGLLSAGSGATRVGLTVSSFLVAEGDPAQVVALVDEDSVFAEALAGGVGGGRVERFVVHLLAPGQEYLADVFAGTAPSPGGPFRQGRWTDSEWGPVLTGAAGHLGVRLEGAGRHVGWALLLEGVVEHVSLSDSTDALVHVRGRYRSVGGAGCAGPQL